MLSQVFSNLNKDADMFEKLLEEEIAGEGISCTVTRFLANEYKKNEKWPKGQSAEQRIRLYESRFRDEDRAVGIACEVLQRGVDTKACEAGLVLDGVISVRDLLQMIGRVQRVNPEGGKTHAYMLFGIPTRVEKVSELEHKVETRATTLINATLAAEAAAGAGAAGAAGAQPAPRCDVK